MMMYWGVSLSLLLLGAFMPSDLEPMPAAQVTEYMPADCEIVGYLDVRGSQAAVNEALSAVSSQAWLTGIPELGEIIAGAPAMLEQAQAELTEFVGFNPVTEVHTLGVCVNLNLEAGDFMPKVLLVIRGSFPENSTHQLGARLGLEAAASPTGRLVFQIPMDEMSLLMDAPTAGLIIVGSPDYVHSARRDTLSGVIDQNSLLARTNALAQAGGVHSYLAVQPAAATRALIAAEMSGEAFAPLITGLERVVWSSLGNSARFELGAANAVAYRNYELLLRGLGEYSLGVNHLLRSVVYLAAGIMSPDDSELTPPLSMIAQHRDEILAFFEQQLLGANSEASFAGDQTSLTGVLTITNTGNLSVSFIVPVVLGYLGYAQQSAYYYDDYSHVERADDWDTTDSATPEPPFNPWAP